MSFPRVAALAMLCLVGLPAVAQDAGALDVVKAKLSLRQRNKQRPESTPFSLRAVLPPSAELLALDLPRSGFEVKFNDVTALHMATNAAGKLFKERRPNVWRMRGGPFLLKLDKTTGALRIKNRRANLGSLAGTSPADVTVSVRFNEMEYTSSVDFDVRGNTWRYRAPRD
jgi:hypothetical protein